MRAHVIAAGVTAAVLSSGLVSALAARSPAGAEAGAGSAARATSSDVADLPRIIESLRQRVSALESELARTRATAGVAPTVTAPFTVVNAAGTPIFTVTGADFGNAQPKGRVHIGRGTSDNYGLWFIGSGGSLAASIGESRFGFGSFFAYRGGKEMAMVTDEGFVFKDASGKQLGHLGPEPTDTDRGRLVVRGVISITDANGNTTVDAGTLPDGAGAVRTWPNADCKRGGLNTCIKGIP